MALALKIPREIRLKISMFQQFSEVGILSKLWAENHLFIANLTLIFSSHDSANLRNFKKTENFQKISFLNLITVNILKKSEYWLNIQPVSVSVSRRAHSILKLDESPFPFLVLWSNKNWPTNMKLEKLKIFWNKMGSMVQFGCPRH